MARNSFGHKNLVHPTECESNVVRTTGRGPSVRHITSCGTNMVHTIFSACLSETWICRAHTSLLIITPPDIDAPGTATADRVDGDTLERILLPVPDVEGEHLACSPDKQTTPFALRRSESECSATIFSTQRGRARPVAVRSERSVGTISRLGQRENAKARAKKTRGQRGRSKKENKERKDIS